MDVRAQQIVVQQHMNDRLAEARMARLAREVQAPAEGFEQGLGAINLAHGHQEQPGLVARFVERVLEAAAAAGHAISPTPPIRVAVRR